MPFAIGSTSALLAAEGTEELLELSVETELLELEELELSLLLEQGVIGVTVITELLEEVNGGTRISSVELELDDNEELELEQGIIGLNGSLRSEPQPCNKIAAIATTINPDGSFPRIDFKSKLIIVIQIFQKSFFDSGDIRNNRVFTRP